eukprot:CAMPEP_0197237050 /NCGR_PEP_ID=MMETSP1429-20130617/3989_1 /TAXON_ID=49237 /ORGANISM="Chaetoceros  sp., Strain UNC1202" /LENGTH=149 /DNA_ID=CAMNT_0042695973 /DNA_START=126 /DNA_END=575 /DNA_ORIENTATION=+
MVAIANQLTWELVKNNNSFMKKVNGRTKRSGSMRFSVEKGNLTSLSTFKHSGIASTQAVGIAATEKDTAVMYTKVASKSGYKIAMTETPMNKPFNKVIDNTIVKNLVENNYRPDLKDAAYAKFSRVHQVNRIARKIKKIVPVKKGRGRS